jgi:hypothetical protein
MKKLPLEDMRQLGERHGGKCLSDKYVNSKSFLQWECSKGHQWKARADRVKGGTWCRICEINKRKDTIEEMRKIAEARGGKCLSNKYGNAHTPLLWECGEGHQWEAVPSSVKRGTWCRKCRGLEKNTIEEMQKIAEARGGKCLSETYFNLYTALQWECSEGHRWEAQPSNIKRGGWCRICAHNRRRDTIEDMRKIAEHRGGKCLSSTYANAMTPLVWECAKGHRWKSQPLKVKRGSWCAVCSGKAKLTLDEMRKIAEERGGKCLSDGYINRKSKLLWECSEGHRWEAQPGSIKFGQWCPECSTGLGERVCRTFFEQVFRAKFPATYPRWLINKENNQMELDGYCKSLRLAFEHHGEQHYSLKTPYVKTEEQLRKRQADDKLKRELCSKKGVVLIEIPHVPYRLPLAKVKEFIRGELLDQSIALPIAADINRVNLNKAYITSSSRKALEELRIIAKEHDGKCLSDFYINSEEKLEWQCQKGHIWTAAPRDVKTGRWCRICANEERRGTIEEIKRIAEERGGKCLSDIYIDIKSKLLFACAEGHQWKARPAGIKQGSWCRKCVADKLRGTLEDMRRIAKERGGKCLSDTYADGNKKLLWECAEGHRWEAIPKSITQGSWCKICLTNKQRGTLREMKILAEKRAGKCLSNKYVNANTPLLWECSRGHQWWAPPRNIKNQGHWCHICGGTKTLTIDNMHMLAKERGGRCLSGSYVNNRVKLLWQCAEGHQWVATPNAISNGQWCPQCGVLKIANKRRDSIENMQSIAIQRGGKCISPVYIGSGTKLLWECRKGHQWWAIPSSVKRGHWCPKCAKLKRNNKLNISLFYKDGNVSV